jgi:nucleoside 2-deoxyribosyltransferase
MRLYLAGPDVFLPRAPEIGARKHAICARHGIEGLFPLDVEIEAEGAAEPIFRGNRALIESADGGIFNLTPFRGPSADAGTVFELGFMAARGKPVFGYTSDPTPYLERVQAQFGPLVRSREGWRDRNGHGVEDFGLHDNLMIAVSIAEATFAIHAVAEEGPEALAALRAFESCVAQIAARFLYRRFQEEAHV